ASQDDRGIGEAKLPGQLPVVCDQTLRRAWVASLAHQDRGTRELPWPGPDITIHQPSMDHPELPSARRTNECIHGNGVQLHSCRIKQEMQPGRGENTKSFSVGEISPEWPAQVAGVTGKDHQFDSRFVPEKEITDLVRFC